MDIKSITALLFFAILIEGFVEYIKLSFQKKMCAEIIGAMVCGVGIAFAYHLDLFSAVGITTDVPYISNVLTGLVLARGSNYVFDLIGKFTEAEEQAIKLTKEQEENMSYTRPEDEINEDTVDHERSFG